MAGVFVIVNELSERIMEPWLKFGLGPVQNERNDVMETDTETGTDSEADVSDIDDDESAEADIVVGGK